MHVLADFASVVMFLAFLVLFVYVLFKSYLSLTRNSAIPIENCPAKVRSKRTEADESGNSKKNKACFVTFLTQDSEETELCVSQKEFEQISVDDEGVLTRRGTVFLRFEIKKE